MSRQTVTAQVEEMAGKVGAAAGVEIVEVELKGSGRNHLLRITIDKSDGVTHGDCETVSRHLEMMLDAADVLEGNYTLEVSSPGVERKLKKPADFARFTGKKARVFLREPVNGRKFVEGALAGVAGDSVQIDADGETIAIPFDTIDRANLKFEW